MPKTKIEKPFCVIGECCSYKAHSRAAPRKWYATAAEAAEHGGDLLRKEDSSHELRVVETVMVVRRKADHEILEVERSE